MTAGRRGLDTPRQQARLDGQVAFLRGHPFHANPHPLNTVNSQYWARGWRIGEDAARKIGVA